MRKTLSRLVAILLIAALMLSVTSCKEQKEKNPSSGSSKVESSVASEVESEEEIAEDESSEITDGFILDDFPELDIVYPVTDDATSTGIKNEFEYEVTIDPEDDGFDKEWDMEDIEVEIKEYIDYDPLIPRTGTPTSGKTREITVHNGKDGIVYTDFKGVGMNAFPTQFSFDAQVRGGDKPALAEINAERFEAYEPRYARSWFQIDWMVTNEMKAQGKDYKDYYGKRDQNIDYLNYMNGIYDFESDMMKSTFEYWKMLEEAGTKMYVAFGWKIDYRLEDWFGDDPSHPQTTAPADIETYVKAAVALFKYARNEVGLTNMDILSFYNEPGRNRLYGEAGGGDFATMGDKTTYFIRLLKEAHEQFQAEPDLRDVEIIAPDSTGHIETNARSEGYVVNYIRDYAADYFDAYSFHCYPARHRGDENKFFLNFSRCLRNACFDYPDKPIWVTEYYTAAKDVTYEGYTWEEFDGWYGSGTAYYISCANSGAQALLRWIVVGGALPPPDTFGALGNSGKLQAWDIPRSKESVDNVCDVFYEDSLINNYVRPDSNVHNLSYKGEDIRCAAFTTKDKKDFTLLVETNENSTEKTFDITLDKSLGGKDVYVFRYTWDYENNNQATIVPSSAKIEDVKTKISWDTDDKYGIYIFTTINPREQLEVYKTGTSESGVYNKIRKTDTLSITPKFVENVGVKTPAVSDSTVKAEIKRYSESVKFESDGKTQKQIVEREQISGSDLGTLVMESDGTIKYTPAQDAVSGDVIAIRCSSKTNKECYATIIVEIV